MTIKAVFVGINKHLDTSIPELSGARRDATALWALFTDTVEDLSGRLMVDEAATHAEVSRAMLGTLAAASANDVVVIAFTGHGSPVPPAPKKTVVLVDDVLTTGAHFVAARNVIRADFPDCRVLGIFIAKRVPATHSRTSTPSEPQGPCPARSDCLTGKLTRQSTAGSLNAIGSSHRTPMKLPTRPFQQERPHQRFWARPSLMHVHPVVRQEVHALSRCYS